MSTTSFAALDAYLAITGPALESMMEQVANTEDREVCAKRARKLRTRGEYVKYSHRTSTGKARYLWTPMTWSFNSLMLGVYP